MLAGRHQRFVLMTIQVGDFALGARAAVRPPSAWGWNQRLLQAMALKPALELLPNSLAVQIAVERCPVPLAAARLFS